MLATPEFFCVRDGGGCEQCEPVEWPKESQRGREKEREEKDLKEKVSVECPMARSATGSDESEVVRGDCDRNPSDGRDRSRLSPCPGQ